MAGVTWWSLKRMTKRSRIVSRFGSFVGVSDLVMPAQNFCVNDLRQTMEKRSKQSTLEGSTLMDGESSVDIEGTLVPGAAAGGAGGGGQGNPAYQQTVNDATMQSVSSMKKYGTDEVDVGGAGKGGDQSRPYFLRQLDEGGPSGGGGFGGDELNTGTLITNSSTSQSANGEADAVGADFSPSSEKGANFQRSFGDGDFEFLRDLNLDDLKKRWSNLEREMDQELEELKRRYHTKRQPILDAIEKRKQAMRQF